MSRREVIGRLWNWLGSKMLTVILLITLSGTLLLSLVIPQAPVLTSDDAAFSRWLAEMRPTLGKWATPMSEIGLFTLRVSLWMRLLLGLLTLSTITRATMLIEQWSRLPSRRRWLQCLGCVGGLLIVIGWSAQTLRGWAEPGLIAWPDETIGIPRRGFTLPPLGESLPFLGKPYGIFLISEGDESMALEVRAENHTQRPLAILTSPQSAPQESLRIALTPQKPDAYFALPEKELGFRLSLQPETQEVQIQVYRIASGELVKEAFMQGSSSISAANLQIYLEDLPHLYFKVVYNPGAPLIALGLLLFGAGCVTGSSTQENLKRRIPISKDKKE